MMNGLYVVQNGQAYYIYTPQGEPIGVVFCGYDGQFARDVQALGPITKALARRWGVRSGNRQEQN